MNAKYLLLLLSAVLLTFCLARASGGDSVTGVVPANVAASEPKGKPQWQIDQENRMAETMLALGHDVDIYLISGKEIDLQKPTFEHVEIRTYVIAANMYFYLVITKNNETFRVPCSQIALIRSH